MLLVYVGSMALMLLFAVYLITGLPAKRPGHPFASRFASRFASSGLPLIATIILCFLPGPTPR